MTNKKFPVTYHQTLTEVFRPLSLKNLKNNNRRQKNEKKSCQKIAEICYVKISQDIPLPLEIIVTYFQTLEQLPWLLRLKFFLKNE